VTAPSFLDVLEEIIDEEVEPAANGAISGLPVFG